MRKILVGVFGVLLWTGIVWAQPLGLTQEERVCYKGGDLMATIAIARDVGTPLADALQYVRQEIPRIFGFLDPMFFPMMTEEFRRGTYLIYSTPAMPLAHIRHKFVVGCLRNSFGG